jgi:hypothetical protein
LIENRFGGAPRADGLRDLGERFADVRADLAKRADELDLGVAVRRCRPVGESRRPGRLRVARHVGPGELRFELVYLASCYPCYGRDVAGRIARCHVRPHRQANGP